VKGKYEPVAVHEVTEEPVEGVEEYLRALALYRNRDFTGAREIFLKLADAGDKVARLYQERCAEFLETPPEENWDGVYVAKSK